MGSRRSVLSACLLSALVAAGACMPARAIGAAGDITTFAGTGTSGHAGDGGQATSAGFAYPTSVLVASDGSVFVSDYLGHRIRKIASSGVISTFAGTGTSGAAGDGGPATSATLADPASTAVDAGGNVYIADSANHRIRMATPAGVISTFAGTGASGYSGDGGSRTLATFTTPVGVEVDAGGNVLVSDVGSNTVRKIVPGGTITTIAGSGSAGSTGDGGSATAAKLSEPRRVAVDGAGNVYIADAANHKIRRVTPGGTISTWAGTGTAGNSGDGGAATSAQLNRPVGIAVDSAGNVFFSSEGNDVIRKVTPAGIISLVAGNGIAGYTGDGGAATSARLNDPRGIHVEPDGDLLFADSANFRVRRITRVAAPAAPNVTATTPASPGTAEAVSVRGTAEPGFTVKLYRSSDCSGPVAGSGTAAAFSATGVPVTVASNSTTTFYATATDSFGTVSGCSRTSVTYVEDSLAPNPPAIGSGPASPGSGRAPSWGFTAEPGAAAECRLTSGSGDVLADWQSCTSPQAYSLTGQPDGSYTFAVRARDAAGNTSVESTGSYLLDSTGPTAPAFSVEPSAPSTGRSPSWSFAGEGGASLECRLTRGATTVQDWAACSGSRSYDLTGEPDATYAFSVRATDVSGNVGAIATSPYELDTLAPAAPAIATPPASPGNDRTPQWSFSGEPGAAFRCRLQSGGSDVEPWATCTSPKEYDLAGRPDGAYTFSVEASDAAGNTGPATTHTYTLDTALPVTPTIDTAEPSPGSGRAPQWAFSSSDSGVTFKCRLARGATDIAGWAACSGSRSYDLTSQADGVYTFSVIATKLGVDSASASATYELDTAAPGDPTFPAAPATPDRDATPEWGLASSGGAVRFECRLMRGATEVVARPSCATPAAFDLATEPDGSYALEARAYDQAGNASGWSNSPYVLDTTAPPVPAVGGPVTPSADSHPDWTFAAAGAAGFECRVERGALVVSDWSACTSPHEVDLTTEPDATYTVRVRSLDAVGNRSAAAPSNYRIDRGTPAVPAIDTGPGTLASGRSPQWSFHGEAGVAFECRLVSGATQIHNWEPCASPRTESLTALPDATYTFAVRATNDVGAASGAASESYELDTTAPGAPAVDSAPAAVGSDRVPVWSFSAEQATTVECQVARGAAVVSAWAACASPRTVVLTGEPDGTYTLSLRARDAAGNESVVTTRDYELDTSDPGAPRMTATAPTPGNARLPAWSFDGDAGLTFECSLARPGGAADAWAACTSPATRDLTGQPDGRYELRVRSVDAAGNRGPAEVAAYELDTQPGALAITDGPAPLTRDGSLTWRFAGEAGATFRCRILRDGSVRSDWAPCASPHTADMAADSDGAYSFAVSGRDAAGNDAPDATWAFTIDRAAPAAAVYEARPPARARDRTPTWTFASEPGAANECRVEHGADLLFDWRACTSPLKVDLRDQDDGSFTLAVRARDAAGNAAAPAQATYRLDTTDPDPPEIASSPGASGDDRSPTWAFTGEARAEFECRLKRDGESAPAWRACETSKTYDLDSQPDDGYAFAVRARDVAGNTGQPATDAYRLRRTATGAGGGGDNGGGPAADAAPAAPGPGADPAQPAAVVPNAKPTAPADDDPLARKGDDGGRGTKGARAGGAAAKGGPAAGGARSGGAGGPAAAREKDRKNHREPKGNVAQQTLREIGKVAAVIADEPAKTAFPISLIFVVFGFMGLQGRIDRNDPKLALAPVFADPDLEFRPARAARAAAGER